MVSDRKCSGCRVLTPEVIQYDTDMTMTHAHDIAPAEVHAAIGRHMLADGYELVLDLDRSVGATLVDARDGTAYLDLFTFFASNALGMNHPALTAADAVA